MSFSLKCSCENKNCTSELILTHIDYDDQNFVELLVYNDGSPNSFYLTPENINEFIKELKKLESDMNRNL